MNNKIEKVELINDISETFKLDLENDADLGPIILATQPRLKISYNQEDAH